YDEQILLDPRLRVRRARQGCHGQGGHGGRLASGRQPDHRRGHHRFPHREGRGPPTAAAAREEVTPTAMPFPTFDRSRLRLRPLAERSHDLTLSHLLPLDAPADFAHPAVAALGGRLAEARRRGAASVLMMGAHVIRAGVSAQLLPLMRRGLITHVAMNGAGPIHDWELSLVGATTESVARYVQTGEFGLWRETGRMNDVIREGATSGLGLGECLGRAILEG